MALIACPECKSEVSSVALKCPKCGVQLRKPTRTFFGKLVKYSFIGFNLLMLFWMIAGMGAASESYQQGMNEAQRAGAAVGTGIGAMLILAIWFFGDVILGIFVMLTRPKG